METMGDPFVEKYRPKTITDIFGNPTLVDILQGIAEMGSTTNLLLCGPPGTGKTTAIHCLASKLLGEHKKDALLELNASDDRGIEVVRCQIKSFVTKKVQLPSSTHKIIILDEVDAMTEGAQQALRMLMTDYSSTTRFALACNDSTKVIDAIQSRCSILRMTKLSEKAIKARLIQICKLEKVDFQSDGIEALVFCADGDMRNALNSLQATISGFGQVRKDDVFKVCDIPHPETLTRVIRNCISGNFEKAITEIDQVCADGYNMIDIVGGLMRVIQDMKMDQVQQLDFLNYATELKMKVLQGLDTKLQLHKFLAEISE